MREGAWPLKLASCQSSPHQFVNSLQPRPYLLGLQLLGAHSLPIGVKETLGPAVFVHFPPESLNSGFPFQEWCEVEPGQQHL